MARLIDADLLIEKIDKYADEMYMKTGLHVINNTVEDCIEIAEKMPIVTSKEDNMNFSVARKPINEWIPVSERLPEKHDEYYVTWKYNYIDNKRYVGIFEFTDEEGFIPDMMLGNRGYIDVIAWMPLPRKYEKEVE